METLHTSPGSSTFDVTMEDRASAQPAYGRQPIGPEARRAAVHEEMKRMTKLPATSTYVSHRLRVLNKILQLLSIQNYITGCGVGTAFFWAVFVSRPFRLWRGKGLSFVNIVVAIFNAFLVCCYGVGMKLTLDARYL